MNPRVAGSTAAMLVLVPLMARAASGDVRTEVRDPVRGVSFHSVALVDTAVNSLEVVEGRFSDSDRIAVGLSALVLDGSRAVDEYVVWIRHEGRRWLEFDVEQPVAFVVDGQPLALERLRASQPIVGDAGRLFETIELRLSDEEFEQLVKGREVELRLRSSTGVVHERWGPELLAQAEAFRTGLMRELGAP